MAEAGPARRSAAAAAIPEARRYASLGELLSAERGLDFADIATPPHLHAEQALACLNAGLHALCEKPLALNARDLAVLRAAADRRDRALACVHNWKHAPLLRRLRAALDETPVGELRHAEWHVLRTKPAAAAPEGPGRKNWRRDKRLSGGGILVDHGWHGVYLLSWLLGGSPRRVTGALKFPAGGTDGGAEEEATVLLEFPAASALLHLSWTAPRRGHWGMLYGRAGQIEIHDDRFIVARGTDAPQSFVFPEPLSGGSAHPDWFAGTLEEFLLAAARPELRALGLREAEDCVSVLEGIYGPPA